MEQSPTNQQLNAKLPRADPRTSTKSVLSHELLFPGEMMAENTAGLPSSGVGATVATGTSVGGTCVGATASGVAVTTMTSAVGIVLE